MAVVNTRHGRADRYKWSERLCKRLRLDGDQWHDGRLIELSFRTTGRRPKASAEVILRVEIYGDAVHARTRTPLTVTFGDVQELVSMVNVTELADMAGDQILFARLNETSSILDLSIHLPGGHIRIVAGRYAVSSAKSKR